MNLRFAQFSRRAYGYRGAILLVFLFLAGPQALSAIDFSISGRVIDSNGKPVFYAKVQVPELKRGLRTERDGQFVLDHVPAGAYTVVVTVEGFAPETKKIQLVNSDVTLNIRLSETFVGNEGIVVTGRSLETEALMAPQPTATLEGHDLRLKQGQNLGQTLSNMPGVTSLNTGNSVGKPFIRGLGGPRVLILSDGIRQEEQQFGDDHPVNLDGFGIQKVEVLRGPASVLYGSDAIGGVVNVIRWKAPLEGDQAPKAGGVLNYDSHSNDSGDGKAASVFGFTEPLGYRVSVDNNRGGRYTTPDGSLRNTGFLEGSRNATVGRDGAWGSWYLDAFHHELRQDLASNPNEDPVASPGAMNTHDKWHFHSFLILPFFKVETDLAWQHNNRREIPDKDVYYPIKDTLADPNVDAGTKAAAIYQVTSLPKLQGLNLGLDTSTVDVKLHHDPIGGLVKGTFGASGITQRNVTIGSEPLIPAYHLWSGAAFAYEEIDLKEILFSGGVRADRRGLDVSPNDDLGVEAQTKNFQSTIGSVGMVWRVAKPFAIALNYGSGFRAPTPFELFANGVHEGTGKFEIGNKYLRPEVSRDVDLSFRYITPKIRTELTFFRNSIQEFIYSESTGQTDLESGLTKYAYRQDPAVLQGGEFSLEAAVLKWLLINGGVDIVRGSVEKHYDPVSALDPDPLHQARILSELYLGGPSTPLPRMPADRLRLGTRFTRDTLGPVSHPYFSLGGRFVAPQDRIDVLETRTPGYSLLDVGAGFEISSLSTTTDKATFDLSVLNATNRKYIDNMDRNKDFALQPGINVTCKLTVPFTLISRTDSSRTDRTDGIPEVKKNDEKDH